MKLDAILGKMFTFEYLVPRVAFGALSNVMAVLCSLLVEEQTAGRVRQGVHVVQQARGVHAGRAWQGVLAMQCKVH